MFINDTAGQNPDRKTSKSMEKTRVLILGGGFGDLYMAFEFQKRRDPDIEVIAATLTTPLAGPARSHRTGSVSRRP